MAAEEAKGQDASSKDSPQEHALEVDAGNCPDSPQASDSGDSKHHAAPPKSLNKEISAIALPMLVALAIDPIASLVDTALIGHVGAVQLAGLGVGLSITNTIMKFLTIPLVSATTTAVAEAFGKDESREDIKPLLAKQEATSTKELQAVSPPSPTPIQRYGSKSGFPSEITGNDKNDEDTMLLPSAGQSDESDRTLLEQIRASQSGPSKISSKVPLSEPSKKEPSKAAATKETGLVSKAATAALAVAVALGIVQAIVIMSLSSVAISVWGLPSSSPAHQQGTAYLRVRAISIPFTVTQLTLQGIFRGLQDTRTPLAASVTTNLLNILLAPLLIMVARWGVIGAAAAVGLAQVAPTLFLLQRLSLRVSFWHFNSSAVQHLLELLKPSGLLLLRTASITATYAFATSAMAHDGTDFAATHQVALSVWLAASLLADALAIAAQALIARYAASGNVRLAIKAAERCVKLAAVLGAFMAVVVGLGSHTIPKIFTTDPQVLVLIKRLMPLLVATQPICALAFVWDGVLFGAGGFRYASIAMAVCALPSCGLIWIGSRATHAYAGMIWIWCGLSLIMLLRAVSIAVPWVFKWGPFKKLRQELPT